MFPAAFVYTPAFDAANGFTLAALLQPPLQQAVVAPRDQPGHWLVQQIVTHPAIAAPQLVFEIDDAALKTTITIGSRGAFAKLPAHASAWSSGREISSLLRSGAKLTLLRVLDS